VQYSETWTSEGAKGKTGEMGLNVGFTRTVTGPNGEVLSEREFYTPFLGR
jgi:hypothetical protein